MTVPFCILRLWPLPVKHPPPAAVSTGRDLEFAGGTQGIPFYMGLVGINIMSGPAEGNGSMGHIEGRRTGVRLRTVFTNEQGGMEGSDS